MIRASSPIKLTVQLAHAGRKASSAAPWNGGQLITLADGGWQPLAPSAIAQRPDEALPLPLASEVLARLQAAFVPAAQRSVRLGFDALYFPADPRYIVMRSVWERVFSFGLL